MCAHFEASDEEDAEVMLRHVLSQRLLKFLPRHAPSQLCASHAISAHENIKAKPRVHCGAGTPQYRVMRVGKFNA